jgi:hypothetical protein
MLESSEVVLYWISYWVPPILGAIAVALGALCVGQFFSFRKRASQALVGARDLESLETAMAQLSTEMQELRERLAERDAERPSPTGWVPEVTGVNLNRRGQVLRLRRRGRTVEEIAATLQLSRGEVELMVKVHELSQRAAGAAGAASSFSADAR